MICSNKYEQKEVILVFFKILNSRNSLLKCYHPLFSNPHLPMVPLGSFLQFLYLCCTGASFPGSLARFSASGEYIQHSGKCGGIWLVLSQLGWFNCQEMEKWNYVKELFVGHEGKVKALSSRQSSQRASGMVCCRLSWQPKQCGWKVGTKGILPSWRQGSIFGNQLYIYIYFPSSS